MKHAPLDLTLECRCGHVRGIAREMTPSSGFRFVCYCQDCQAFARFLKRPDVLNAAGGTDIVHMPPSRLRFTTGADAIRCMRLSNRVFRWYTECCRTPIANTAGPRFPVAGLIRCFVHDEANGRSWDEVLGPPRCRIFERSAIAPLPPNAPPPPSFRLFAQRGSSLLGWWLRGLGRPTPFFDSVTSAPLSAPHLLTPSERAGL